MRVSVEAGQGLERRLTVALPGDRIEQEIQNRLHNLARSARIAGFRPGKAPLKVVQQRFGKQVRGEVLGDLIRSSFNEAIKQEQLRPASGPKIEPPTTQPREGEGLEYVATFEVFPEFELAPVASFKIEKPVAEVTEQDVDEMIEVLRKQRTQWVAVDRSARDGDRVTIDYTGTVPGQEEKIEAEGIKVTLGAHTVLPEFEQQLAGAVAGEERQIAVSFPQDYPVKSTAGKAVDFTVKVSSVEEPHLPEVDEAFAAGFGVKEGGVEALRREVAANMRREMEQTIKDKVKTQVMDLLLSAHPIELPRALIERERERLQQQAGQRVSLSAEQFPESLFDDQARRRVALGLILGEFIKRHGIRAESARVRAVVDTLASSYEDPAAVAKWIYGNRAQMAEIESMVVEDQVVDWVLAHAQIQETPASFKALMNREPNKQPAQSEGGREGVSA